MLSVLNGSNAALTSTIGRVGSILNVSVTVVADFDEVRASRIESSVDVRGPRDVLIQVCSRDLVGGASGLINV